MTFSTKTLNLSEFQAYYPNFEADNPVTFGEFAVFFLSDQNYNYEEIRIGSLDVYSCTPANETKQARIWESTPYNWLLPLRELKSPYNDELYGAPDYIGAQFYISDLNDDGNEDLVCFYEDKVYVLISEEILGDGFNEHNLGPFKGADLISWPDKNMKAEPYGPLRQD